MMSDPIIETFYEEYSNALSFLHERGYSKQQIDEGLVQRLVFSKEFVSFCFVLDVRDAYVDDTIKILLADGEVGGSFLSDLLTREELQDAALQRLQSEIRQLLQDRKFMRRLQLQRDKEAARLLFQKEAQWVAIVLQRYETQLITRMRSRVSQSARPPYKVVEVAVSLYIAPRNRPDNETLRRQFSLPRGVSPPEFPTLPLEGLVFGTFRPTTRTAGTGEAIEAQESEMLWLELYLPNPLQRGSTVQGLLAPLIEPRSGLVLEWCYAGGVIGEVIVKEPVALSVSQFEAQVRDVPRRDLRAEFWEWARSVQHSKRQR